MQISICPSYMTDFPYIPDVCVMYVMFVQMSCTEWREASECSAYTSQCTFIFQLHVHTYTVRRPVNLRLPRRSEPVPLERGCYTGVLPLRAPHARTLGAEDSSIYLYTYIYMYNLIAKQQQKKRFIIQRWTNTRKPTYLHTYLPTYIHSYIHHTRCVDLWNYIYQSILSTQIHGAYTWQSTAMNPSHVHIYTPLLYTHTRTYP